MECDVGTKDAMVTKQQSLALVKNMLRISISSICFHRDLFQKESFVSEKHDSSKIDFIQILSSTEDEVDDDGNVVAVHIRDPKAFLLTQWLERGVFAAIDDGFLSSMSFAIFTSHPLTKADVLVETYKFKVTYPTQENPHQGTIVNDVPVTKKCIKHASSKFVRSLIEFARTLDELPESRWITLQLDYNSACPDDYEPEFFKSSLQSIVGFDGTSRFIQVKIGQICTDDHTLKVRYEGLEHMQPEAIEAITPLSAIAKAKLVNSSGQQQLHSVPKSPFVGQSTKSTPQGALPETSSVTHSLNQLMLSQKENRRQEQNDEYVQHEQDQQNPSTPMDQTDEETELSKIHEFLIVRKDATIAAMSRELDLSEEVVKNACAELVGQGLVQSRGRTRFAMMQDEPAAAAAARVVVPPPTTHRKIAPPAPKKKPRENKDQFVEETVEEIDSEPIEAAPAAAPQPMQPKLRLQKTPASASRQAQPQQPSTSSANKREREREEQAVPTSQTSEPDHDNNKKKRSIIKDVIHLTSHKHQQNDYDDTESSIY